MSEHPLQLRAAYGVWRHIARSAAKNFYYGFLVLPAPKRDAICREPSPAAANSII